MRLFDPKNVKISILTKKCAESVQKKRLPKVLTLGSLAITGGLDGTRTRDPLRDRQVF